jgi:hypothetical protein
MRDKRRVSSSDRQRQDTGGDRYTRLCKTLHNGKRVNHTAPLYTFKSGDHYSELAFLNINFHIILKWNNIPMQRRHWKVLL